MPRFFKEFFENSPIIEGDDAKHIQKSLRMRIGEPLVVCDTKGNDYHCKIKNFQNDCVQLVVEKTVKNATEPTVFVTLYQCLVKGDKIDTIVKQAVEMGVSQIVPVISANCVSRPDEKTLLKKQERWQKIANEAAGQSGRGILPSVCECISFKQLVGNLNQHDITYFCYELGGKPIDNIGSEVKSVALITGPEGGFTAEEAKLLQDNGAVVTTLGPRILRAETAPVAAVAAIMLQSGNMK